MVDMQNAGKRMKQLRRSMGYTQDQFAEQLHISRNYMCKLENGTRTPSLDVIANVAEITGTSIDYIVTGK